MNRFLMRIQAPAQSVIDRLREATAPLRYVSPEEIRFQSALRVEIKGSKFEMLLSTFREKFWCKILCGSIAWDGTATVVTGNFRSSGPGFKKMRTPAVAYILAWLMQGKAAFREDAIIRYATLTVTIIAIYMIVDPWVSQFQKKKLLKYLEAALSRPVENFNQERARALIGKTILVGYTYLDESDRYLGEEEMFGTVRGAGVDRGVKVELHGSRKGQVIWLPPDLRPIQEGEPGIYRLKGSGENVTDPDFFCYWTVVRSAYKG